VDKTFSVFMKRESTGRAFKITNESRRAL